MISKNCKYSYYDKDTEPNRREDRYTVNTEQLVELFHTKHIYSMTGYRNYLSVALADAPYSGFSGEGLRICKWTPDMVEALFGINQGLADIINSYLGRKASTADEARIYFMAKILGDSSEI